MVRNTVKDSLHSNEERNGNAGEDEVVHLSPGVPVDRDELEERLRVLYEAKDVKEMNLNELLGPSPLDEEALLSLLTDNTITDFDPVEQAFKVYDPDGTGAVDLNRLRTMFERTGVEDITDEDMEFLKQFADGDGDNRITLEDFRNFAKSFYYTATGVPHDEDENH